ncbi:bacterial Ig-like domain-containing protein, partial [Bariatricus massiliensis]
ADYEGLTVTKDAEKTLTNIIVTAQADKVAYEEGDTLDLTGLVVTAYYSNGETADVTALCSYVPAQGQSLTELDSIVAIAYTEGEETVNTTMTITVIKPEAPRKLDSIKITGDAKKDYKEGESF